MLINENTFAKKLLKITDISNFILMTNESKKNNKNINRSNFNYF